ncbi:MAG: cell cycle transcriptional regulator TrcR [Pseudomonadota bacterium]
MSADLLPLMPKATAVWLVDNTTLTFRQIAEFCGMHELEVSGIADGEVAIGIKGFDPIQNNQLTAEEIKRCEGDPVARLRLLRRNIAPPQKKKGPRYTPVSKRQDRPAAIAWLTRNHPEIETSKIVKLVGSTKPTIEAIRNRTHWNSANIQPVDPVALGLCTQVQLDVVVREAAAKKAAARTTVGEGESHLSLMPTEESLAQLDDPSNDPLAGIPERESAFAASGLDDPRSDEDEPSDKTYDPDALFNLPRESS